MQEIKCLCCNVGVLYEIESIDGKGNNTTVAEYSERENDESGYFYSCPKCHAKNYCRETKSPTGLNAEIIDRFVAAPK